MAITRAIARCAMAKALAPFAVRNAAAESHESVFAATAPAVLSRFVAGVRHAAEEVTRFRHSCRVRLRRFAKLSRRIRRRSRSTACPEPADSLSELRDLRSRRPCRGAGARFAITPPVGGDAVRWETVIACEPDPTRRRHLSTVSGAERSPESVQHVWAAGGAVALSLYRESFAPSLAIRVSQ